VIRRSTTRGVAAIAYPCTNAAVDDQMNWFIACNALKINIEVLTATREGGVIWGFQIGTHQRQN